MSSQTNRSRKTGGSIPGKPLLKWPGGKRKLIHHLAPLVPASKGRYYEPFFGGGALFFSVQPDLATLSDANAELIDCYEEVKANPDAVLKELSKLKNSEASYYKVRASEPILGAARAAKLLYLTTLAFNGIYRQNLQGKFNVPYGQKSHIRLAESIPVLAASHALRQAKLLCADFETGVAGAVKDDVVYFDPPYTVAHGNNGFVKYNAKIFSWADQQRLAAVANSLADQGCTVIVSNADHPSILRLYPSFAVRRIERQSVIAASSAHRSLTTECIFVRECQSCS